MKRGCLCLLPVMLLCILLGGCKKQAPDSSGKTASYTPGSTLVLTPEFSPTDGDDLLSLDLSRADQGYFTAMLNESGKKVNLQVTGPDGVVYKYFLESANVCTAFPFTAGSGPYVILALEYIGGNQYATRFSCTLDVELASEFLPFLYPNQYVDFSEDSEAVRLAGQLSENAETDLDALTAIYGYVTENIVYDYEKAETVESGYLPDIDETLRTKKGICFDFASLTAAMLRALSIPARLEIGYCADVNHAWVDVYIESQGWVENAVEFNGSEWQLMDPTFGASADDETVRDYTGDGENYVTLYVR